MSYALCRCSIFFAFVALSQHCAVAAFAGLESSAPHLMHNAAAAGITVGKSIHHDIHSIFTATTNSATSSPAAVVTSFLQPYKQLLVTHPLTTKMATGATLAVMGDAIAQSKTVDEEYDVQRAASFAAFDMCYRALQHVSFPLIVDYFHGQFLGGLASIMLAGSSASMLIAGNHDASYYAAAMEQTLASQLGIVPFLYYPVFFSLTGFMQGLTAEGALNRAQENFLPLMKRNLLFWIPVQFVQFGFIEEGLQIPFLSVCGLAWTFILSVAAGSAKTYSSSVKHIEKEYVLSDDILSTDGIVGDMAIDTYAGDATVVNVEAVEESMNGNVVALRQEVTAYCAVHVAYPLVTINVRDVELRMFRMFTERGLS